MSKSGPVLQVTELVKSYAERRVLHAVSFTVAAGDRLALTGPSGSGKSTLLNCLGGVDRADSGDIRLEGRALNSLSSDELARVRRERVGTIFQFFHLLPTLSAFENIELPLLLKGMAPDERRQRTLALLDRVDLTARSSAYPGQLSGGEQQRVAIARALAHRPALLLADEPTGNLDSVNGARILALLAELSAETGSALVLVTHSEEAAASCPRRIEMLDGRIVKAT